MTAQDTNAFLHDRVTKKLNYSCTARINSTGRGVIVNSVLLSSFIFFTSLWGGIAAGVDKATAAVKNYMWFDALRRARTKVSWTQCYMSKDREGINMVSPKDALVALMTKWILKTCEPGVSNLHELLRYRLSHFQPYQQGRWSLSLKYFTLSKFQAKQGSNVWTRVGKAWRKLQPEIRHIRLATLRSSAASHSGGHTSCL